MNKLFFLVLLFAITISCNNKKESNDPYASDKFVVLHNDTVNVVKKTDTLLIFESTCRGCAYEGSTKFSIEDSLDVIKLYTVDTHDNNSGDMAGGSVSKTLILLPNKTGKTTFKLYKFWKGDGDAKDSANARLYTVEVKE